jgi:hypothetical protein
MILVDTADNSELSGDDPGKKAGMRRTVNMHDEQ